jgi:hypothetical protein
VADEEEEEHRIELDEDVAKALAEELRKLKVEDVLIQMLVTISSIGYRRLGLTDDTREDRDLRQVELTIETMKALTPVLSRFVGSELVGSFEEQIASLQLAYAKAAQAG